MGKKLFDDGPDDKEINQHVFKVNKKYAESYNRWRYSEVMSQLKHTSSYDTSSESDSSDGEFVEPNNPEFDEAFLQTLKAVNNCDTQRLKSESFFKQMPKPDKKKKRDTADKPMSVDEYQLRSMFEHQRDEEHGHFRKHGMSQKAKEDILKSISAQHQSSGDESDDLLSSGLFRKKTTPTEDQEKDKRESRSDGFPFKKASAQKNQGETSQEIPKELLKSKEDTWLFDYFINKRYLGNEDSADIERFYDEVTLDEEDISKKNEMHDCKFKYRFQEPDQDFLKKYPRHIESSMRPRDDKRSRKREARHIKKEKIKQQKKLEIEKLKAIKKQEIMQKIKQIKEASGNDNLDLADDELDGDFNPEHHDAAMAKAFPDEYYELEGDEQKPAYDYDDDGIIKDYDDWMDRHGPFNKDNTEQNESWKDDGEYDLEENEESHVTNDGGDSRQMSKESFQKEMLEASSRPKQRRRSRFSWALAKKKPIFNPEEKEFEEYFDEYYQLDFEDIVCGMPCRFKYHRVEPNNFGLDTAEILAATDKDLNQWYSMKKLMRYNRHPNDEKIIRENFSKRAKQAHIKRKYLPSLFADDPEEVQNTEMERRRLKNQKKKMRRQKRAAALLNFTSDDHNDSMKNYTSYVQGTNSGSASPEKNIETTSQIELVESDGVSWKKEERLDHKTELGGSLTGSCKSPAKKKKKSHSDDTSVELHAASILPGKKNKQEMKLDVGSKYVESHPVTSVNPGRKKADYESKPDESAETSIVSPMRSKEKLESDKGNEYYESAAALCSPPKKKEKKQHSSETKSTEMLREVSKETEDVGEWEHTYSYDKIQDAYDGQNRNKKSKKKLHKKMSGQSSTEFISGSNSFKQKESCGGDISVCNSKPDVVLHGKEQHRSGDYTSEIQNANNKKPSPVNQPDYLEGSSLKVNTDKTVHKSKKKGGQHKTQELYTSSLNWKDLPPHERVPKLFSGISDMRLKAYGLNPRKTKIKVTYYKKKE